jgi:hypothetical protein
MLYWNDLVNIVIIFIPRVRHLNSRPTVIHEALDRHRVHPAGEGAVRDQRLGRSALASRALLYGASGVGAHGPTVSTPMIISGSSYIPCAGS